MSLSFQVVKNHKISNNLATTDGRENLIVYVESFDVCLTKFKNNQISLNKISHRVIETTNLFSEQNIPISSITNKQIKILNIPL
jgi:hypothetical protein